MKAIILAAGQAKRLHPLTLSTPKCLLEVAGKPILTRTLEALAQHNINQISIVTGFMPSVIKEFIDTHHPSLKIDYTHNPDFATTDNAYSLSLLKRSLQSDFLLLDSDIVFQPQILQALLKNRVLSNLAVQRRQMNSEEVKVILSPHSGQVLHIGKHLNAKEAFGEAIGITYFTKQSGAQLFEALEKRIEQGPGATEFYEASFQELINSGHHFSAIDVTQFNAIEIDDEKDLKAANKLFSQN